VKKLIQKAWSTQKVQKDLAALYSMSYDAGQIQIDRAVETLTEFANLYGKESLSSIKVSRWRLNSGKPITEHLLHSAFIEEYKVARKVVFGLLEKGVLDFSEPFKVEMPAWRFQGVRAFEETIRAKKLKLFQRYSTIGEALLTEKEGKGLETWRVYAEKFPEASLLVFENKNSKDTKGAPDIADGELFLKLALFKNLCERATPQEKQVGLIISSEPMMGNPLAGMRNKSINLKNNLFFEMEKIFFSQTKEMKNFSAWLDEPLKDEVSSFSQRKYWNSELDGLFKDMSEMGLSYIVGSNFYFRTEEGVLPALHPEWLKHGVKQGWFEPAQVSSAFSVLAEQVKDAHEMRSDDDIVDLNRQLQKAVSPEFLCELERSLLKEKFHSTPSKQQRLAL
jgi:hypothetical protein